MAFTHKVKISFLIIALIFFTLVCMLTAGFSGDGKIQQVEIALGSERYIIPSEFYFGGNPDSSSIKTDKMMVSVLLPSFNANGINSLQIDSDGLDITLYSSKGGESNDPNNRYKNTIKYQLVDTKKPIEKFGLSGFYNSQDSGFTLYNNKRPIIIDCAIGIVNDICKVYTYHVNGNLLFYIFHLKHLHNWENINDKVVELFKGWEIVT